jgi:ribosome-associated toxin RatA of RatAB toxin-antitoxin module
MKRSTSTLQCSPALLYEILTDYDNCVEWLPQLSRSKSLATEGDLAIAEFHLSKSKRPRIVVECIHTRDQMVLWRTIEGETRVTQAEWTIEPGGDGQSRVSLAVESRFEWSGLLPGRSTFLSPPSALKGLRRQAASYSSEMALTDQDGEKILEISETDEGMVCWIRGKKYILTEEGAG